MKRIGDILVEAGVITAARLHEALGEQRLPGERLGGLLVRLGLITEDLLVKALARQLKMPVLDISSLEISDKVLSLIPRDLQLQHLLMPVAVKKISGKNYLIVAMGDPTLSQILARLEEQVPYAIRPGVAAETMLRVILKERFGVEPKLRMEVAGVGGTGATPSDEPEERTASISVRVRAPQSKAPVHREGEDGEVTMLTHRDGILEEQDSEVMRQLTEPTNHRILLAETAPAKGPVKETPAKTPMPASPPEELPRHHADELKGFVQQTNKNILLEAVLQVLIDRRVVSLEDLMTAVEAQEMTEVRPLKLGEILLQAGIIDKLQLNTALKYQREWDRKLGEALVELGFISEVILAKVLSKFLQVPNIELSQVKINSAALQKVPRRLAEKYGLIPVDLQGDGGRAILLVAMIDPTNLVAIDEVAFTSGCRVKPVVATHTSIDKAIRRYYGDDRVVDVFFDTPASAPNSGLVDEVELLPMREFSNAEIPLSQHEEMVIIRKGNVERVNTASPSEIGAKSKSQDAVALSQVSTDVLLRTIIRVLVKKGILQLEDLQMDPEEESR